MGYKLYLNITSPDPIECAMEDIGEVLPYEKMYSSKTSHTLKTDVFELPDNKNFGKLFSKYQLFFLDPANSSISLFCPTTFDHTP